MPRISSEQICVLYEMALIVLVLFVYLLNIIYGLPTHPDCATSLAVDNSLYTKLMEHVCNDLTFEACVDRDGFGFRYSVFDPITCFCVCSTSPSAYLTEKKCPNIVCTSDRPIRYYWPESDDCFCEIHGLLSSSWNYVLSKDLPHDRTTLTSIFEAERNALLLKDNIQEETDATAATEDQISPGRYKTSLPSRLILAIKDKEKNVNLPASDSDKLNFQKRQNLPSTTSSAPAIDTAVPTFVPPPKVDITPELINQSLTIQPQNTATVSSVIPQLLDCIITFLIQLDGIVADSIPINASCTFPCGTIGSEPQPDIMLVPKCVQNGTYQAIIPDCRCIAVNMYDPNVITYWIQNKAGAIFSLLGSNKVFDIDQIDTGQPIALSMLPNRPGNTKRDTIEQVGAIGRPRRQVVQANVCDRRCPQGAEPIPGALLKNPPECGCLVNSNSEVCTLTERGLTAPGPYTATMTKEACEAMKCINNSDAPAMFNPFSLTCWCAEPEYVDVNKGGWVGGGSGRRFVKV